MTRKDFAQALASAAALTLAGCGAGGSGGIASISTPPVTTPTPTPSPPPTPAPPPIAPPHLGLVSSAPFAMLSVGDTYKAGAAGADGTALTAPMPQAVQFSYSAATNSYQINLPGFEPGTLADTNYGGSSGQPATNSASRVTTGATATVQPVSVYLFVPGSHFSRYTYTSLGWWDGQTGLTTTGDVLKAEGIFAYGIPTLAGDVPITGSASYAADVFGSIGPGWTGYLSGTANLSFDFAGGKLSGSMHAGVFDTFDGIIMDFGTYAFKQTVYSTGGATFSGKFDVPSLPNADSFFDGNFTGPGAAELMARFAAPYLFKGQQGTMSGVWVGKKN